MLLLVLNAHIIWSGGDTLLLQQLAQTLTFPVILYKVKIRMHVYKKGL